MDIWTKFDVTEVRQGKPYKVQCKLCPRNATLVPMCANTTRMRKHYAKKHEHDDVVQQIAAVADAPAESVDDSQDSVWEGLPALEDVDGDDEPQGIFTCLSHCSVFGCHRRS